MAFWNELLACAEALSKETADAGGKSDAAVGDGGEGKIGV